MDKKRKYLFQIEVEDGEIDNILHELDQARETIYRCYSRLNDLGMVVVKNKETASGN